MNCNITLMHHLQKFQDVDLPYVYYRGHIEQFLAGKGESFLQEWASMLCFWLSTWRVNKMATMSTMSTKCLQCQHCFGNRSAISYKLLLLYCRLINICQFEHDWFSWTTCWIFEQNPKVKNKSHHLFKVMFNLFITSSLY